MLTTTVYSRPVSLFEPLITAELAYSIHFRAEPRTTSELEERVRQLLAHFEWQRVTPALVYRLLAAGLTEVSIILASSPAAFSTNATQIDAHVVHRPNDPQILCTTGDQTPFSECLQGETCNIANSSLSEIAAKTYYTQKEDPGKPGISARTMEAADELLTKAPVSVGLLGVGYEAMDTVGLDVIAKYMSSLSSTKCQVQKTSVSLGSRLSTTVADKPVGKLMWVDGADTTFPLSTLDNKSGFGGNYFNTTGTGANPKTRPVIKTRPCGTFCMEKSLDELCLESADDVGFVKKANLDVDLSIFDRPLVDESQNTVTEFENDDDDDDDCDSGDASVIKDVSPVYKAKYTRKTTMQAETIFATGAYSKATRRPLDREVISLVHSRHPPPPTPRSRKPNAKLPTPPKEQKGAPAQAKKEPEHSNKPPAPESPQGAEKSSETKEPKKEESEKPTRPAPPTRKPPPPPSSGKGVLHRKPSSPATPKKTPNASAEGAATPEKLKKVTVGQQGTPTAASVATPRRAPPPPVPGLKLQQKAAPASPSQSPQQEAPGTPKTAPAAHELTTPKTGPKGTGTPTSARRLPPMQKTSPSAMRRAPVPPSKTQQPRPAPSRPVPKMSPTAEAVIGTT